MTERTIMPNITQQRLVVRKTVDRITNCIITDMVLQGSENLEKVRELAKKDVPIIFMLNHLSNMDGPAIINVLSKNGFSDIAKKIVFLLGMQLKKNKFTNLLTTAYKNIPVWPPSLKTKNREQEKEKNDINASAIRSAQFALKEGFHLLVFPEAIVSKNSQLLEGNSAIFIYTSPETVIVPMGIIGTEKVLKPGSFVPKCSPVTLITGSPISVSSLGKLNSKEKRQKAMSTIMCSIANLLPIPYRGTYS